MSARLRNIFKTHQFLKEAKRQGENRGRSENLENILKICDREKRRRKTAREEIRNRSCDRKYSQVYHNFPSSRLLPAFFFVIYVSFHTFRIYTRYLSFGLFISVLAFHQLIIYGHLTPRIAVGLLFVSKKHCPNMQNLQIYDILATASLSSGRYRSFSSHWFGAPPIPVTRVSMVGG